MLNLTKYSVECDEITMKTYLEKKGFDFRGVNRRKVAGKWISGAGNLKSPLKSPGGERECENDEMKKEKGYL